MSRNRQHGHVGNLGDVTKHAALVELAAMLAERFASVSFVDTHTFLLHAPLANAELWRREADNRLAKQPAYARYFDLERAYLERTGEYRCSSGLVLDVLGEQLACAVLGEANGLTRAELKGQLAEGGTPGCTSSTGPRGRQEAHVPSAGGAARASSTPSRSRPGGPSPALDALSARAAAAVFVLYSFTRAGRTAWPVPPIGTSFVAEHRGAPHEVALFVSAAVEEGRAPSLRRSAGVSRSAARPGRRAAPARAPAHAPLRKPLAMTRRWTSLVPRRCA
ncbi:MAG: hypothetical protein IPG04_39205 [Polyangiaceae bacterium]|nr:hypothetical protein [Polyangiaceae bacterium]